MKATLTLTFDDGTSTDHRLEKCIILDVADRGRNELSFRQTSHGWVMTVSKPLLEGKKLHDNFVSVKKQP